MCLKTNMKSSVGYNFNGHKFVIQSTWCTAEGSKW